MGCDTVGQWQLQDVGTVDSGLNSVVLASNNEMVLLPINEPTFGTRRKSQIQVRARPHPKLRRPAEHTHGQEKLVPTQTSGEDWAGIPHLGATRGRYHIAAPWAESTCAHAAL